MNVDELVRRVGDEGLMFFLDATEWDGTVS